MTIINATEAKRIPAISVDTVGENVLVFSFSHGEQLRLDVTTLSDSIRNAAMMHGFKQKMVDAAAIARNTDTGRSATIEDKFDAVKEIYDRITKPDGTWNKIRGEGGAAGNTLLAQALMELFGKTRQEIDAFLDTKSPEQKNALKANERVAPIIARIQASRNVIDTDDLLGELA